MQVALIQADLVWEDITANLAMLEEQIAALPEPADVIVLPEMFSTGFSMNASVLAEAMNITTTRWLKMMAAQTQALVIGSFQVKEDGNFFNRLLCVRPEGTYEIYDKRHLFRFGAEHETFTAGNEQLVVNWKGWRICPLICYDLRFPVWSRQDSKNPYDLLLYVANWPAARAYAWDTLLRARAIENLSYVLGVNRVGRDGNGIEYSGGSLAVDFLGEVITDLGEAEGAKVVRLSKVPLEKYRKSFPALLDADDFLITTQLPSAP
ncbi:amidohydrolase [Persicitalea jodogahamensis]|uniref:amidohydrolase n=1 Tax=Persicitalea jodogahamensis TaxID=402147 RepID=UPI00167A7D93|nr:amidohydrolase [Persicitalea jodogahamensis]